MPVKIESFESMSMDEFDALRRQRVRQANPMMAQLLDEIERGAPVRVPVGVTQTARGLRVAIARAASARGLHVESLEGNGFVAVRRSEEPQPGKSPPQAAGTGKWRGRPRRQQDHTLEEVLEAADNERIVPEPIIET